MGQPTRSQIGQFYRDSVGPRWNIATSDRGSRHDVSQFCLSRRRRNRAFSIWANQPGLRSDNFIAIQLVPGGTSRQVIVVLDTTSLNFVYLVGDGIGPSQYGPTNQVSDRTILSRFSWSPVEHRDK